MKSGVAFLPYWSPPPPPLPLSLSPRHPPPTHSPPYTLHLPLATHRLLHTQASCPPWVEGRDDLQPPGQKHSRMRLLHQMWSTAGYTAAAAEAASRAEGAAAQGDGRGGPRGGVAGAGGSSHGDEVRGCFDVKVARWF